MKCFVFLFGLDHHWGYQRFQPHWRYCDRLRWAPAICMSVAKCKSQYKYLLAYIIKCTSIDLHEIVAHRISQSQFTSYIVNQRCTCIFYIVLKVRKAFRGHKPSESCIIIIIKVNLRLEALYFYMVWFFLIYLFRYLFI